MQPFLYRLKVTLLCALIIPRLLQLLGHKNVNADPCPNCYSIIFWQDYKLLTTLIKTYIADKDQESVS